MPRLCLVLSTPVEIVTDALFAFIFEVVIIRYDKVARDRGIVHMITTRTYIT